MSYTFCKRFPEELSREIFEHILNKALNNRMVDPNIIFIDGTNIKASANKKKFQKERVAQTAKIYSEQLRQEVNAEREKLGKKPIEDKDDDDTPKGGGTKERTVSTTDPDGGMFVKGEHERQFAYEAHSLRQAGICGGRGSNGRECARQCGVGCVIHTTEAWPQSLDGSGLNMLP